MLLLSADDISIQKMKNNLHIRKIGQDIKIQSQFEFHITAKEPNKMSLTINIKQVIVGNY